MLFLPEKDIRRAEERLERVPSVVVDALEEVLEDEVDESSESSESELEEELEESPKKARSLAMVRP